jgi:signal transduction histidine kinase
MDRAEQGLQAHVHVKSSDDIGLLGHAFNSLLTRLERARKREERYHYEQMKRADRLASIGEMAAGIAHEIKNPLTGIAGVIQLMKKDMAPDNTNKAVLEEACCRWSEWTRRSKPPVLRGRLNRNNAGDINDLIAKLRFSVAAVRKIRFSGPEVAPPSLLT